MLEGLLSRWRGWRYGGITGQNLVEANAKMTSIVAGSWLVGYIACFAFIPDPFLEFSIIGFSVMWIFGVWGYTAYVKVDATNYRPFPQSQWKFPDGGKRKYNLMIRPETGFSKEYDFKDGSQGWRWDLGQRFQYWDKRMEFPFVFDYALIKQPKEPDACFQFTSEGEFFWKGFAIKLGCCEDISIWVYDWVYDKDAKPVPVGALVESSLAYDEFLKKKGAISKSEMKKISKWKLAFEHERRRRIEIEKHSLQLEDMVEEDIRESRNYRKSVEKGMSMIRDLCKSIMQTEKPLIQRLRSSLKWILVGILVLILFLWFMGVF